MLTVLGTIEEIERFQDGTPVEEKQDEPEKPDSEGKEKLDKQADEEAEVVEEGSEINEDGDEQKEENRGEHIGEFKIQVTKDVSEGLYIVFEKSL